MELVSNQLVEEICKVLSDHKGRDIVKIYVRDKSSICDYFVLASGTSSTHIKALGEKLEEELEKKFDTIPTRAEGLRDGRWAVIDYGDVIVHIFNDETRLFYHLERLWSDGKNLEKYEQKPETI